jgi:hypothetical protein
LTASSWRAAASAVSSGRVLNAIAAPGATAISALLGSVAFAGVARLIWLASIRRYTSASS